MDKPVFMKSELEAQLPMLKKQNLRNASYAEKTIQQLFTKEQMENVLIKEVNYTSSSIALNGGKGNFTVYPLPAAVQFSSVKAILHADVNKDGTQDLVLGGNEFGFQPQLGRLDAGEGAVLTNDGKGNFTLLSRQLSGLQLHGQVRDIIAVKTPDGPGILILQNNEYPVLYQLKKSNAEDKTN
jgi:enediyne biosynthesis protein E4